GPRSRGRCPSGRSLLRSPPPRWIPRPPEGTHRGRWSVPPRVCRGTSRAGPPRAATPDLPPEQRRPTIGIVRECVVPVSSPSEPVLPEARFPCFSFYEETSSNVTPDGSDGCAHPWCS